MFPPVNNCLVTREPWGLFLRTNLLEANRRAHLLVVHMYLCKHEHIAFGLVAKTWLLCWSNFMIIIIINNIYIILPIPSRSIISIRILYVVVYLHLICNLSYTMRSISIHSANSGVCSTSTLPKNWGLTLRYIYHICIYPMSPKGLAVFQADYEKQCFFFTVSV